MVKLNRVQHVEAISNIELHIILKNKIDFIDLYILASFQIWINTYLLKSNYFIQYTFDLGCLIYFSFERGRHTSTVYD